MKMKALLLWLSLATVLMTSAIAQDLDPIEINVVGNIGVTTQFKQIETPFWTTEVNAKSAGAISANFKPWNEIGLKGPEVFRLLARGVMNIATAQLGHHAGDAAINDGSDLAGLSTTMDEFRAVTDAFRPVLEKYYADELGLKILTLQSFQSQILYCRDEFTGLADLKGRKVRSSGASQADFIEYFGGTGVNLSFAEVQQALQQGVIDCAITGTLGGYSAKWHEGAKYLYTLPINFGAGATVANGQWWNSLPENTQMFLKAELKTVEDRMWALNREEDEIGISCNSSGPCPLGEPAGMIRVDPSQEDLAKRREAMLKAVLPAWSQRCGEQCVSDWNASVGIVTGLTIE